MSQARPNNNETKVSEASKSPYYQGFQQNLIKGHTAEASIYGVLLILQANAIHKDSLDSKKFGLDENTKKTIKQTIYKAQKCGQSTFFTLSDPTSMRTGRFNFLNVTRSTAPEIVNSYCVHHKQANLSDPFFAIELLQFAIFMELYTAQTRKSFANQAKAKTIENKASDYDKRNAAKFAEETHKEAAGSRQGIDDIIYRMNNGPIHNGIIGMVGAPSKLVMTSDLKILEKKYGSYVPYMKAELLKTENERLQKVADDSKNFEDWENEEGEYKPQQQPK